MRRVELVVVGAGPAGCAAAVQAARLGVRPLLLDRQGRAGGLIENARWVENYPGLEGPVSGPVFAARLGEHLERFGLSVERAAVETIEAAPSGFLLRGDFGELLARSVIAAVGTAPRPLEVPGEAALRGDRLVYEVKPLLARRLGRVIVIGGGEAAFDYSLSLAGVGARVEMCIRSSRPAARGRLVEQVAAEERITVATGLEILEVGSAEGEVVVSVRSPEGQRSLRGGAVLVAVGRKSAAASLFAAEAPAQGWYLVGDARRGALGQAGMAVGDGLGAAAEAVEYLRGEENP